MEIIPELRADSLMDISLEKLAGKNGRIRDHGRMGLVEIGVSKI